MKKLMIATVAAATVGGAFAAPQAYDMTITVKATECKDAKKAYKNVCADDVLLYRAQNTQKFYGKFWGCDCDVIACPDSATYGTDKVDQNGYIFWGSDGAFHSAEMAWSVLQLVGKQGTNIEGAFDLNLFTCDNGTVNADPSFALSGAGYGTALVKGCADADNYIKSMSGNIVGTYNVSAMSVLSGCKYCGDTTDCMAWDFCDCLAADSDISVAFGTFTLKYNASQAKAVAGGKSIRQANKFKSFVTKEFACIAAGETPVTPVDDPKATAQKNFKAAKDALDAAEKAVEALGTDAATSEKGKALAKAADDAAKAVTEKTAVYDAAKAAVDSAVVTAKGDVSTAEAAVKAAEDEVAAAVTQSGVETAKKNLKTAQENLDNAKTAYANAKAAALAKDADAAAEIAAFETADAAKAAAEAAKAAAEAAKTQADKAVTAYDAAAWQKDMDAAGKALKDAKDAYDYARIACAVNGADCK